MKKNKKQTTVLFPQNELKELGQLMRRERKARHLSQTELAQLAGVGINFVSQIEGGKPTAQIGKILHLLKALGLEFKLIRGSEGLGLKEK